MTKATGEPKILRVETRNLPTRLTPDELALKADELAKTVQEVSEEEDRQKNIKDQMKARLSELQSRQTRLALVVSRREEYRDAEVVVSAGDNGLATEARKDTGEIIATRPLREDEKQIKMELDKVAKGV